MTLHRFSRKQRNAKSAPIADLTQGQQMALARNHAERIENGQLNRRERRHYDNFIRRELKADKILTPEQKQLVISYLNRMKQIAK